MSPANEALTRPFVELSQYTPSLPPASPEVVIVPMGSWDRRHVQIHAEAAFGAFVGYENFNFEFALIAGRLKGGGATLGACAGWNVTPTLRCKGMFGRTALGYDAPAGTAAAIHESPGAGAAISRARSLAFLPPIRPRPSPCRFLKHISAAAAGHALGNRRPDPGFPRGKRRHLDRTGRMSFRQSCSAWIGGAVGRGAPVSWLLFYRDVARAE